MSWEPEGVSNPESLSDVNWEPEGVLPPYLANPNPSIPQFVQDAGRRAYGSYVGMRDLLPEVAGGYSDPEVDQIRENLNTWDERRGDDFDFGGLAVDMAIPSPTSKSRIANTLGDAGIAFAQEYLPNNDLVNAIQSGGWGAGGRMLMDTVSNRFGGAMSSFWDARKQRIAGQESRRALADKYEVPLTYGEEVGKDFAPNINRWETASERLPGRMSGFRKGQNESLSDAFKRTAPTGSLGREAEDIIQRSMMAKEKASRRGVGHAYDRVSREIGDARGTMDETAETANRIIAENASLGQYQNKVPKGVNKFGTQYDEAENALPLTDLGFEQMRQVRSSVGDDIAKLDAARDFKKSRPLKQVKKSMDTDMTTLAEDSGSLAMEAELAARKKNMLHQNIYNPAKGKSGAKAIRTAIDTDEPDKIFKLLITKRGSARVKKALSAMGTEGREAVKKKIFNLARDNATNADGVFSPAKVIRTLEDHRNGIENAFPQADVDEINGLIDLMTITKRAGQFAEDAPTGRGNIAPTIAGMATGWRDLAGMVGTSTGFSWLTTTPAGKKVMRAISLASDTAKAPRLDLPAIKKAIESQPARRAVRQVSDEVGDFIIGKED